LIRAAQAATAILVALGIDRSQIHTRNSLRGGFAFAATLTG